MGVAEFTKSSRKLSNTINAQPCNEPGYINAKQSKHIIYVK